MLDHFKLELILVCECVFCLQFQQALTLGRITLIGFLLGQISGCIGVYDSNGKRFGTLGLKLVARPIVLDWAVVEVNVEYTRKMDTVINSHGNGMFLY